MCINFTGRLQVIIQIRIFLINNSTHRHANYSQMEDKHNKGEMEIYLLQQLQYRSYEKPFKFQMKLKMK